MGFARSCTLRLSLPISRRAGGKRLIGASQPAFFRLRGVAPSGSARGLGEGVGNGVLAMGNRRTQPSETTSQLDKAEQPAKTCEPGEGTEPVARLCWQRSEKEPEQAAKTCEPGEGTEPVARLCRQRRRRASGASDKGRWATDGRSRARPPHNSTKRSSLQRRAIRARAPSPSHVFAGCGAKKPRSCW